MGPIQTQMVFRCAEQWIGGLFYQIEPYGDGLRLDRDKAATGVYCMKAVDSGERGFRWDRVVVEADLPPDTALRVYAYAADHRQWGDWDDLDDSLHALGKDPTAAINRIFGPPAARSGDFYLQCTGRYLWLAFELTTTGMDSPVIHVLRLWMNADHMVDYLPAIYREQAFTRRFLSIFNSMYADMERCVDNLPGQMDYEYAEGEMLRCLADWVCADRFDSPEQLRQRIRTALPDYENLYTVEGVRRSVRRLTGREPILIEHAQVSPNRPDCTDPTLYRRLYGDDPYRFFVLLPEDTFANQSQREQFQREMEGLIPAGMQMQMIQLKQCIQLDWHTYLGVNSRVGSYMSAAIDEQVTIHYDTTIGGADYEQRQLSPL